MNEHYESHDMLLCNLLSYKIHSYSEGNMDTKVNCLPAKPQTPHFTELVNIEQSVPTHLGCVIIRAGHKVITSVCGKQKMNS